MVTWQAAIAILALGQGQTVLLDFYADWCGPCRSMDPTVKRLAAEGYPVRQVNIDREQALANQFHVRSIPCFVMLSGGREVDRVVGAASADRLVQMCRSAGAAAAGKAPIALAALPRAAAAAGPLPPGASCPVPATNLTAVPPLAVAAAAPGTSLRPDSDFLAVTVRLRIADKEGRSCGSGTIIDARQGEALILTCGHIFRDSQGKGQVEVDLFGPTPAQRIPGHVVSYDLQSDVGLVSIHLPGPVAVAPVAPPDMPAKVGDPIVTAGCNNGDDPTIRHTRINALDKYLGPPNVVVDDIPVVGRSGGGLFTPDGYVIGVCNAADPPREGLYAAAGAVRAQLDRAGVDFVYRGAAADRPAVAAAGPPAMPKQMPKPLDLIPAVQSHAPDPQALAAAGAGLSREEQGMLAEMRQRAGEDAEVIVIIRPRQNPQAKSEVLMLDRASPALLERLGAERPTGFTSLDLRSER